MSLNDFITTELLREIAVVLNSHNVDSALNTPDFILAEYVAQSLAALQTASVATDRWYGTKRWPEEPIQLSPQPIVDVYQPRMS